MLQLFKHKTFAEEWRRRVKGDSDTTIDRDVFDGMRGKLTQAHIDAGTINNCRKCPVALALTDMLSEHSEQIGHSPMSVEVNKLFAYIFTDYYGKVVIIAEISGLLDEWIHDFDERSWCRVNSTSRRTGLSKVSTVRRCSIGMLALMCLMPTTTIPSASRTIR